MAPTPPRPVNLMQTLIDGSYSLVKIPTITINESELGSDHLSIFDHPLPIGISPGYSAEGKLVALAIADSKNCRIFEFNIPQPKRDQRTKPPPPSNPEGRKLLQETVLCRSVGDIFAFDMGTLSMSLYCDVAMRITHGVDIQSAFSAVDRKPLTAIESVVGDTVPILRSNVINVFRNPIYDQGDRNRATDLAMRAWVSQFLAGHDNGAETFEKVPRIDTYKLVHGVLDMIAKVANDALRLDQMKPTQRKHQITTSDNFETGQTKVNSMSFKNKIRSEQTFRVSIGGASGYAVRGRVGTVLGRTGNLDTGGQSLIGKTVTTLTSIGRDDPTTAEAQRAATILRILQGTDKLLVDSPWIKNIWFPPDNDGLLIWPEDWSTASSRVRPFASRSADPPDGNLGRHSLNASQQEAVNTMLSPKDTHRITLIQGPPGTGKTSVIATYVQQAIRMGHRGIWLVAQSNVAVKNIAEKLASVGFFDWRLLVSKDFHLGWHEHLYTKVSNNLIRSDDFNIAQSQLRGCQVILCTLSMLSNSNMQRSFIRIIPLNTLIVDEASQIEIGNYIPVFADFHQTLRKACFIGDDKQLPPYGQEDLQDLQSIFEITHLRKKALFLDIQYRMPPQIGQFISEAVYDAKLKSNPQHPITNKIIACRFIDVAGTEQRQGDSWKNELECNIVLILAQQLQDQEKLYRIITPYEGQRSLIEGKMQDIPGLQWGDKCFNVDSFQGNEEDYIIISLVRSRQLGFLKDLRRTNVMLTRCKKGMFIVSSQAFLKGVGGESLTGQLMREAVDEAWLNVEDIEAGSL